MQPYQPTKQQLRTATEPYCILWDLCRVDQSWWRKFKHWVVASCSHCKKEHWAIVWGIWGHSPLCNQCFTWTECFALWEFCSFLQMGVWQRSCILRLNYTQFRKRPLKLDEPPAILSISQSNYVRHDSSFFLPLVNQGRWFLESIHLSVS